MCAIIGSSRLSMFEAMYQANLPRGNFASGLMGLTSNCDQLILKQKGTLNFESMLLPHFTHHDFFLFFIIFIFSFFLINTRKNNRLEIIIFPIILSSIEYNDWRNLKYFSHT